MIPITKEQFQLYGECAKELKQAQERLQLCLSAILAGHGITSGEVKMVTSEGILLAEEEKPVAA